MRTRNVVIASAVGVAAALLTVGAVVYSRRKDKNTNLEQKLHSLAHRSRKFVEQKAKDIKQGVKDIKTNPEVIAQAKAFKGTYDEFYEEAIKNFDVAKKLTVKNLDTIKKNWENRHSL